MNPESIEKELNCVGYYGFGGGYQQVGSPLHSGQLYCGLCPLNAECWEKHKERVNFAYPAQVEEMAQLVRERGNPAAMQEWFRRHRYNEPYTLVMCCNIEDGTRVGSGSYPKDRG